MNKICGIYKITSPANKIYIGKSVNITIRKNHYIYHFGKGQPKVHNSIIKYGWESHTFEIICVCERHKLNDLEKYYIKLYDTFNTANGLNLTSGGENSWKITEETRLKMSLAHKGRKHTIEAKEKISESNRRRIISEETKEKQRIAHANQKCSEERKEKNRNRIVSESTKEKHRNQIVSDETRQKMSNSRRGKTHSEETKQKMRESKKRSV